MVSVLPPQGLSEVDYETIEAAVTETVRGRWFLGEFARRNRTTEMRQLLDAMGRLESAVAAGQAALAPADPSVRLFMQRIKEVSGQLERLSGDMRAAGVAERFALAVENEARAVGGMIRGAGGRSSLLAESPKPPSAISRAGVSKAEMPLISQPTEPMEDPRLRALSELDRLSLTEKLAVFS